MVYCSRCGTGNRDQAQHCVKCGAPLAHMPTVPQAAQISDRGMGGLVVSAILGLASVIYLLNPGAGVLELIPDNLPIVGNLDEGVAGMLLLQTLYSVRQFISRKRGGGGPT